LKFQNTLTFENKITKQELSITVFLGFHRGNFSDKKPLFRQIVYYVGNMGIECKPLITLQKSQLIDWLQQAVKVCES